ncbi:MBL fold metallo-hydrolase [Allonocardiopsis opalescens]|uniref:Glyoxylase-like metal-dependent hydrolase (Beta-lactamase superfamily II) n=1 Tax=Allonocardiopsis opalescens TaxID=1144618 RepID=A0A2T0Q7P3_9ACTN|nr:MBL fold metallo-hydrolase [Allonocardiopsis opalescens]PRX99824.1 glyoxylase-like metal-dependent hydrolase (beta-lactamase superfamily II) [Allonocardiopsis opalescens]
MSTESDVEVVELLPHLHMLRFMVGQAYVWRDGASLTLIDAGPVGAGPGIARALRELGHGPEDVDRVVVTHFHEDHTGSLAEVAAWAGAVVVAHRADAPFVRGELAGPAPDFADWERELRATIPVTPPSPPARVDHEVDDGDVLDFGGGAQVVAVPGHTDGSIALYLPEPRVLFTGDTAANPGGQTMLGVFNLDRERTAASFLRLAGLDAEIACFGHGDPILSGASAALRAAATRLGS